MRKLKLLLLVVCFQSAFLFVSASEYVAFVKEGKLYHLIDETGTLISKQPMTKVTDFFNGYASCVINKKWYYIDQMGNTFTVAQVVDKLHAFKDGLGSFLNGNGWGFMNNKGEVIIPPSFESVKMFDDGKCWVKKLGKWFQIDETGKPIFDGRYVKFELHTKDGIARVRGDEYWGFINTAGKEVAGGLIYNDNADFVNGKAFVKKGELWGVIDVEGNFIIEPKYVKVWKFFKDGYALVKIGEYIGVIDNSGKEIVSAKYDKVIDYNEGFCGAELDDIWDVFDLTGKNIAKGLSDFEDFQEGYAVIEKNEQVGLLTETGEIKLLGIYDKIEPFVNGFAQVMKNERWGYIDKTLTEIIPPKFLGTKDYYTDWTIVKAESELWGFIDKKGTFQIPAAYERADMFVRNKQADVEYGCNQTMYITSGFTSMFSKVKLLFVEADMEDTKIARVKYNGQWAFVDKNAKLILSELDNAETWVNGYARFRKDDKWGFVDINGNVVVEPKYELANEMTKVCK